MRYRILLVGGGSGGHIFPLVAVIRELQGLSREKNVDLDLMVVSDDNRWKSDFKSLDVKFRRILTPKFRRVEGGQINLLAFLVIPFTIIQAFWILFVFMPDLVFSKGGFVSLVPISVAGLYFIPTFIHESDAIPGLANKFASRFAKKVFISFEGAAKYFDITKTILSGNPIRESLLNGNKTEAANYFKLNPAQKTILFLAGSQGAVFINKLVISSLTNLIRDFQLIHQSGIKNFESVKKEIDSIKSGAGEKFKKEIEENYRVQGFFTEEELKNAYALADIVVARSGSNIFEIAAVGKPAIVIPYRWSAQQHQQENAREFAKFGAAVLDEENLTPTLLISQLKSLLRPESYQKINQRIKQFAKLDAAKIIVEEIIKKIQN